MALRSQQPFPAMRQSQPEFAIVLVRRLRGKASALLDLILEEIGCFEHWFTTTKAPLTGALTDAKRGKLAFVPNRETKTRFQLNGLQVKV